MKIGIIGSGAVGTTLAQGFAERKHDVMLGTGHPDAHRNLPSAIRIGSFADAALHGEVCVLAVHWPALDDVVAAIPGDALDGKVLIDTSNPLDYGPSGPTGMAVPAEGSAGQHIAARFPEARVVKAFNCVGANLMIAPQLPGGPPDMFICGDDAGAKATVANLCDEVGNPAYDCGPLARSAQLEHLALLWIFIAVQGRDRGHAFKLLRIPT